MIDGSNTTLVITPICCVECNRTWDDGAERWRLKVLDEVDGFETVPYCPSCHAREFEE